VGEGEGEGEGEAAGHLAILAVTREDALGRVVARAHLGEARLGGLGLG